MSEYVTPEGVPLRGDGSPFPEDPNEWSAEERAYLESYAFGVNKTDEVEHLEVAMVDIPAFTGEGGEAVA